MLDESRILCSSSELKSHSTPLRITQLPCHLSPPLRFSPGPGTKDKPFAHSVCHVFSQLFSRRPTPRRATVLQNLARTSGNHTPQRMSHRPPPTGRFRDSAHGPIIAPAVAIEGSGNSPDTVQTLGSCFLGQLAASILESAPDCPGVPLRATLGFQETQRIHEARRSSGHMPLACFRGASYSSPS